LQSSDVVNGHTQSLVPVFSAWCLWSR